MLRKFSEFSFKIHFKFEEVSMEKVVLPIKSFKTIFYFKFLDLREVLFGSKEV
jgi:hypothetical protein